ncbi:hypothetical protein AGMMS49936_10390 [Endomicrobiia bacterium]|nr:hypothetical protein AGMMS49936_10390 [Endomicrobiia bacterium]
MLLISSWRSRKVRIGVNGYSTPTSFSLLVWLLSEGGIGGRGLGQCGHELKARPNVVIILIAFSDHCFLICSM